MLRSLVLTIGEEPHRHVKWHRAISMLMCRKCGRLGCVRHPESVRALVLRNYTAHVAQERVLIPAVIKLTRPIPYIQRVVRYNRINVLLRDKFRCCYDGQRHPLRLLTLDHVKPRKKWDGPIEGLSTWTNVVTACKPCNLRKGARTPKEAGMPMHFQPHVPDSLPPMPFLVPKSIPDEWVEFLPADMLEGDEKEVA